MDTKDIKESGEQPVRAFLRPNETSYVVIGCAMRVHSVIGPGALESAVQRCLHQEMCAQGLHVQHQVGLPLTYNELRLPAGYRADFVVENCVIVEVKCVSKLLPVHFAQLLTYLKQSRHKLGLLLNFNVPHMRDGIRRVINGRESDL